MKSPRRIPALLFVLAALALTAACSEGNDILNSDQGNVRVVLSADGTSAAAASTDSGSPVAPGSTGTSDPSSVPWHGGDDDDDDDHDGDDILSRLAEANVTFASLLARNLDGQLIDLTIELPQTVNLLGLTDGRQITLPIGTLPPGMYDQMVVVITEVEFVFLNGGKIALTPPGGGWTRVLRVTPFEVLEGETITIELRFRPRDAFRELDGKFSFFPEFDCRKR